MNKLFAFLLVWIGVVTFSFSQEQTQLTILDKDDHTPLMYCNVGVKNKKVGGITNSDGKIRITVQENDTLLVSYIGYNKKQVPVSNWVKNKTIYLQKINYKLSEVTVLPDKDYLYDIMLKCRKKMRLNTKQQTSKTYYTIETKANDTIIEFLEAYYNAYFNGLSIDNLKFKQGRFGLGIVARRYFVTMSTSRAISSINLLKNNQHFPFIPTQCNKRKLKKYFDFHLIGMTKDYFEIAFEAQKKRAFNGVIFLSKKDFDVMKLSLNIENTHQHPFVSIFQSSADKLSPLNLSLNYQFNLINNQTYIDLIHFDYSFKYFSNRKSSVLNYKEAVLNINSKSTLYFYDYEKEFILPYFEFDQSFGDYYSMAGVPYNPVFWYIQTPKIQFSDKQQKGLDYLVKNGRLVNYKKLNSKQMNVGGLTEEDRFFNYEYHFWSKSKRLILPAVVRKEKDSNNPFNFFNFKAQLLLDITDCTDSLHCQSFAVFDPLSSDYYLPKDSVTNAFMNIYFDIYEIERRKMQTALNQSHLNLYQIDSLYQKTLDKIEQQTSVYFKEVKEGACTRKFKKWNQYVIDELGIDNVTMSIEYWIRKRKEKEKREKKRVKVKEQH